MADLAVRIAVSRLKHLRSLPFRLLTGLAFLTADNLVLVLDALAQIGFGLTDGADIGGKIANLLLVDALMTILVCSGVSKVIFSGASRMTGWLKPMLMVSFLPPSAWAR